jgi:ammonia channel protein AmtB
VNFLAGSAATLFIFIARPIVSVLLGKPDEINMQDPQTLLGCFLAGLVSISAPCGNVTNEAGILIGVMGTFVFLTSKKLI